MLCHSSCNRRSQRQGFFLVVPLNRHQNCEYLFLGSVSGQHFLTSCTADKGKQSHLLHMLAAASPRLPCLQGYAAFRTHAQRRQGRRARRAGAREHLRLLRMRRAFARLAATAATRAAARTRLHAAVLWLSHSAALRALKAWRGLAAAKNHRRRQVGGADVSLLEAYSPSGMPTVVRDPAGWTSLSASAVRSAD